MAVLHRQAIAFVRCGPTVLANESSKTVVHRHNATIDACEAIPSADEIST